MSKRCTPETLAAEMESLLDEYAKDVKENTEKACLDVADYGKNLLESTARGAGIGGDKYVKSFSVKKESNRLGKTATIYNKQYQLTHLLENGHIIVTQNGHSVSGISARPFPHWQQCEEKVNEMYEKAIEEACKK